MNRFDRDQNARNAARALHPKDLKLYLVEGYRLFAQSGMLNETYDWRIVSRVSTFDDSLFFSPLETAVLNALQAAYGDALVVETVESDLRTTAVTTEIYCYYSAHIFHKHFLPLRKYGRKLDWTSSLVPGSRLEDFCIHGDGIDDNLIRMLREFAAKAPEIDAILEPILGAVAVPPDDVRNIPTWTATRLYEGRGYEKGPSFGRKIGFDSTLLLTDGVVVDLGMDRRYRVWFDYTRYTDDDGWMANAPSGERALRIQRTNDRITTRGLQKYESCYMRGKGTSSQASGVVPFRGRAPYCLMSFHADGGDYRYTVMVDLDDNGEIVRAWVEGSH